MEKLLSDVATTRLTPIGINKQKDDIAQQVSAVYSRRYGYFFLKRTLDITIAICLLFLVLPLFLLIPLIIKLSSPGPIIFKQKRLGLNGRHFTMYKFRSMVNNAEQFKSELEIFNLMNGPVFKMKNDPRVNEFGRFLRKTSMDELPQLWNVLKGQMSMVGPRPFPVSEVVTQNQRQYQRLKVKPGFTCLWQIKGRSNITDFDKWLRLDLEYIKNSSISLDIRILLRTVPAVIIGLGAE